MLISIFSAYFLTELRDLAVSARSEEHRLADILKIWELPVLILLSFFLQFILAIMVTWRKYRANLTTLVILTLPFADWVANVALAVLFKKKTEHHSKEIITLWTPFLLLHLGGPDPAIINFFSGTALWNQLLGLFIQAGVALYVYTRFPTNSSLTYVAIPIFIAGIIKYGERIWALREAKRMQSSDYSFFNEKASAFTADQSTPGKKITSLEEYLDDKKVYEEGRYIHKAFRLFKMFRHLFLDRKVKIPSKLSEIFIPSTSLGSAEDAFRLVEVELEFLYDMLYTNKTTLRPVIFEAICLLSSFTALIAFSIEVGKSAYPEVDIAITYLLLGGAVFLIMFSIISRIFSKWAMLQFTVPRGISKCVHRTVVSHLLRWMAKKKQGRVCMGQNSLMDYCLKTRISKSTTIFVSYFNIEDILEKFWLWQTCREELVNDDLRNFIHCHLLKKHDEYRSSEFQYGMLSNLLREKGDGVLKRHNLGEISWSINEVEFDHSLLIWHIATDLLFHFDHGRYSAAELGSHCQISKHLSDYMMYLLCLCPNMLPKGMGKLRMKETRKELIGLFINMPLSSTEVVNALFGLDFELAKLIPQSIYKSKSVIAEGCQLALMLRELDELCLWDHNAKWKLIADVWMEMLAFAASRCEWREHKTQLRHGGELLTHVSLLMTHFGLTERIEMVKGYSHHLVHFHSSLLGWDWEELSKLPYYLA